jgi:hypothetical protein
MKIAILFAAILLPGLANPAQKPALTPARCDADRAVWAPLMLDLDESTYKELEAMVNEMSTCARNTNNDTPQNIKRISSYESVSNVQRAEMLQRMSHFLGRHDLTSKFLAEDQYGDR